MAKKMRKPARIEPEDDSDDWLVTFADAITLLLAFFVLTTSISEIKLPTFEEAQGAIQRELGRKDVVRPIASLESSISQVLDDLQISNNIALGTDAAGVIVEVPSLLLFPSGSSNLKGDARSFLEQLFLEIGDGKYKSYVIEVQAHADPGSNFGRFPGLWDLTAARAVNLTRYMIWNPDPENQFESGRLKAVAYGDSRPRGEEDWKIKNQEDLADIGNERIVLRIHPPLDARGRALKRKAEQQG